MRPGIGHRAEVEGHKTVHRDAATAKLTISEV